MRRRQGNEPDMEDKKVLLLSPESVASCITSASSTNFSLVAVDKQAHFVGGNRQNFLDVIEDFILGPSELLSEKEEEDSLTMSSSSSIRSMRHHFEQTKSRPRVRPRLPKNLPPRPPKRIGDSSQRSFRKHGVPKSETPTGLDTMLDGISSGHLSPTKGQWKMLPKYIKKVEIPAEDSASVESDAFGFGDDFDDQAFAEMRDVECGASHAEAPDGEVRDGERPSTPGLNASSTEEFEIVFGEVDDHGYRDMKGSLWGNQELWETWGHQDIPAVVEPEGDNWELSPISSTGSTATNVLRLTLSNPDTPRPSNKRILGTPNDEEVKIGSPRKRPNTKDAVFLSQPSSFHANDFSRESPKPPDPTGWPTELQEKRGTEDPSPTHEEIEMSFESLPLLTECKVGRQTSRVEKILAEELDPDESESTPSMEVRGCPGNASPIYLASSSRAIETHEEEERIKVVPTMHGVEVERTGEMLTPSLTPISESIECQSNQPSLVRTSETSVLPATEECSVPTKVSGGNGSVEIPFSVSSQSGSRVSIASERETNDATIVLKRHRSFFRLEQYSKIPQERQEKKRPKSTLARLSPSIQLWQRKSFPLKRRHPPWRSPKVLCANHRERLRQEFQRRDNDKALLSDMDMLKSNTFQNSKHNISPSGDNCMGKYGRDNEKTSSVKSLRPVTHIAVRDQEQTNEIGKLADDDEACQVGSLEHHSDSSQSPQLSNDEDPKEDSALYQQGQQLSNRQETVAENVRIPHDKRGGAKPVAGEQIDVDHFTMNPPLNDVMSKNKDKEASNKAPSPQHDEVADSKQIIPVVSKNEDNEHEECVNSKLIGDAEEDPTTERCEPPKSLNSSIFSSPVLRKVLELETCPSKLRKLRRGIDCKRQRVPNTSIVTTRKLRDGLRLESPPPTNSLLSEMKDKISIGSVDGMSGSGTSSTTPVIQELKVARKCAVACDSIEVELKELRPKKKKGGNKKHQESVNSRVPKSLVSALGGLDKTPSRGARGGKLKDTGKMLLVEKLHRIEEEKKVLRSGHLSSMHSKPQRPNQHLKVEGPQRRKTTVPPGKDLVQAISDEMKQPQDEKLNIGSEFQNVTAVLGQECAEESPVKMDGCIANANATTSLPSEAPSQQAGRREVQPSSLQRLLPSPRATIRMRMGIKQGQTNDASLSNTTLDKGVEPFVPGQVTSRVSEKSRRIVLMNSTISSSDEDSMLGPTRSRFSPNQSLKKLQEIRSAFTQAQEKHVAPDTDKSVKVKKIRQAYKKARLKAEAGRDGRDLKDDESTPSIVSSASSLNEAERRVTERLACDVRLLSKIKERKRELSGKDGLTQPESSEELEKTLSLMKSLKSKADETTENIEKVLMGLRAQQSMMDAPVSSVVLSTLCKPQREEYQDSSTSKSANFSVYKMAQWMSQRTPTGRKRHKN